MKKPNYKPGKANTATNNPSIRAEAARRYELEKIAAAKVAAPAPAAAAPAPAPAAAAPVAGKGFNSLNKSSLPYGARMMIERYDNEKKLRKNV